MSRVIYFARCMTLNGIDMGVIKIGTSLNAIARTGYLGAGLPYQCELLTTFPGGLLHENLMHAWLRRDCVTSEYFHDRGEVRRLLEQVVATGKCPLDFTAPDDASWVTMDQVRSFMDWHGLTLEEIAKEARARVKSYQSTIKGTNVPSRRFVAAMTCAALRKGHRVDWTADMSLRRAA